jgi:hypothetical protein
MRCAALALIAAAAGCGAVTPRMQVPRTMSITMIPRAGKPTSCADRLLVARPDHELAIALAIARDLEAGPASKLWPAARPPTTIAFIFESDAGAVITVSAAASAVVEISAERDCAEVTIDGANISLSYDVAIHADRLEFRIYRSRELH